MKINKFIVIAFVVIVCASIGFLIITSEKTISEPVTTIEPNVESDKLAAQIESERLLDQRVKLADEIDILLDQKEDEQAQIESKRPVYIKDKEFMCNSDSVLPSYKERNNCTPEQIAIPMRTE